MIGRHIGNNITNHINNPFEGFRLIFVEVRQARKVKARPNKFLIGLPPKNLISKTSMIDHN